MNSFNDVVMELQCGRGVPRRGDVADERQRDLAVGADLQRLRYLLVFVDLDAQFVADDQPVVGCRGAAIRGSRSGRQVRRRRAVGLRERGSGSQDGHEYGCCEH
jgi:hypothetical protein